MDEGREQTPEERMKANATHARGTINYSAILIDRGE